MYRSIIFPLLLSASLFAVWILRWQTLCSSLLFLCSTLLLSSFLSSVLSLLFLPSVYLSRTYSPSSKWRARSGAPPRKRHALIGWLFNWPLAIGRILIGWTSGISSQERMTCKGEGAREREIVGHAAHCGRLSVRSTQSFVSLCIRVYAPIPCLLLSHS